MNVHKNARSLPASRELMASRVEEGWSVKAAAEAAGLSVRRAAEWVRRSKSGHPNWSSDRSSRPRRIKITPANVREQIIEERKGRLAMKEISSKVGCSTATVARVLAAVQMSRLRWDEPLIPVVRYERKTCGELLHLDIKRFGRIVEPGHRVTGIRKRHHAGYEFLHVAIDDHSRLTYSEVLADQTAEIAVDFLGRAIDWYAAHGIKVQRVLTDNGGCYRSRAFVAACERLSIVRKRTRPYTPRTNGKAERMIQTLIREWAYKRPYSTSDERTQALPPYLHRYNHHRKHASLADLPPISRLNRNNVLRTDN